MANNQLIGGTLLGAGALFIFQETASWLLGQALSGLPLPKLPNGNTDMSALPWMQIIGILLLGAGLYFLWRSRDRDQQPAVYDDSALRTEMADSNAAIEALAAGVAQLERKLETTSRLALSAQEQQGKWNELTNQRIQVADDEARGAREYAEGTNHSVTTTQAEAEKAQRLFIMRMETWVRNLQRKIRYGFEAVDNALAAVLDRENMQKRFVQIEEVYEELSGPTDRQEPIGDMNAWIAKYGGWYRNVEVWARLGEKYRVGTIKRVFAITDSDYEGDWKATDDLFLNSKAVHKYKTFRIYARNFFAELEAVHRCVEQAAFVHPTKRPQPVLEEEDDDDQPYIPPPPPQV